MTDEFLTDGKVILRGFRREDLIPYRHWWDNRQVTEFMEMGWKPADDAVLEATYNEVTQTNNNIVMVIVDPETEKPIGTTGLYLINWPGRRAQFRILIGEPDYLGRGFGTAATRLIVKYGFERVNLETIYLGANEENVRAIRSYEKAGFIHEGVQRNFVYNNGRYYNSVMMSILRGDYDELKSKGAY